MVNDLACEISSSCREGRRERGEGSVNEMGGLKPGSRCDT
jgi:hypothetical protein